MISVVFKGFLKNFRYFFDVCSDGFQNELIANIYFRLVSEGEELIGYGKKLKELIFIFDGDVELHYKKKENVKHYSKLTKKEKEI